MVAGAPASAQGWAGSSVGEVLQPLVAYDTSMPSLSLQKLRFARPTINEQCYGQYYLPLERGFGSICQSSSDYTGVTYIGCTILTSMGDHRKIEQNSTVLPHLSKLLVNCLLSKGILKSKINISYLVYSWFMCIYYVIF